MMGAARSALPFPVSLVGILAGALLGLTASEARSACAESSGAWTCTGVETTPQGLERSGSTLDVSLDSGFDMDAAEGVAFTLSQSGAGGIVFVQAAGGQEIVGHTGVVHATNSGTGDISITATGALRKTGDGRLSPEGGGHGGDETAIVSAVQADASGGSVTINVGSLTGASGIGGGGHGVMVRNAGAGTTAITASGAIDTGSESGDGVNVVDSAAASRQAGALNVSVATVTGWGFGIRIVHRGGGNVSVRATGAVTGGGGKNQYIDGYGRDHAISVTNADQDSDISVAAAAVTALGGTADAINVTQEHGGDVSVVATGSVSAAGRHGIFVDQRGDGSVSIRASGSVTGGGGDGDAAIKVAAAGGGAVTISLESGAAVGRAGKDGIVASSGTALIEVKAGAVLKGDAVLGDGSDTLNLRGGAISGDVHFGDGDDILNVHGGAVSGGVHFDGGDDTLNLYGGTIANVDLGGGSDTLNFQRGVSIVNGDINGTPSLHFRSGAVARIANSRLIDYGSSIKIGSGAIAILDGLGVRKSLGGVYGGVTIEGTLNTADGVMGSETGNSSPWWAVMRIYRVRGTTGTWVMDTDFDRGRADALAWNAAGDNPDGAVLTLEPAMLSSGYWNTAPLGFTGTAFVSSVPEAFSIDQHIDGFPNVIRQVLPSGTCASGGSGAFACTGLIWEEQNLSASGTDRLDVVLGQSTTVVHALAGTRRGLSLAQTGSGGISLRQTSGRHRIAAAGHAIHASASGTGAVSIQVDGAVIGGLTGRVPDADGISAAAAGGAVSVSASSVTGLRHGIAASAGGSGGVEVEARGAVAGRLGNGVYAAAAGGSVTVTAAAVAGGQVGILARAAGPVSISVSGPVTGGDGDGDAAIKVEAGENAVRISLESGAVVGRAGRTGIVASSGSDLVEVKSGAEAKGGIRLGDGDDVLSLRGGSVAGVDFGGGSDALNFERGASTVTGDINGTPSLRFKSGAVARIADSRAIDYESSIGIERGAIAILDGLGLNKHLGGDYGGITIEGTLNTADGVLGNGTGDALGGYEIALRVYKVKSTTGSWIMDADFGRGRTDMILWNGFGYDFNDSLVTVEPAMLSTGHGRDVIFAYLGNDFRSSVPEAFSVVQYSNGYITYIRQTLPGGTCTSGSGGAFTCTNLIWEQQNLSASGTDRLDVVLGPSTTVVHALAGTRRGLSLAQTGSGGISLRQTSGRHRIAAAGHAIHASASGTGAVSIQVDGAVIGGLTGRVPDADGIAAAAAGGAVSVTAGSVTGLRHGITARAGGSGGVQVRASGAVIGRFGHGVHAEAPGGGATVAAASVSGGQAGILASAAGPVSISVSGSVTGGGNAAITAEAGEDAAAQISLESGAVVGRSGGDSVVLSGGTALLEVNAGARVNGDVRLGGGSGALTLRGGAISGDVHFGDGDDIVNFHGGTVAGIDLGGGSHAVTFQRGVSEVTGGINGTARIDFKSGAVARIANSRSIGWHSGMDIEKGAIAILDGHGWRKHFGGKYGGITVEGTLNTADGTVGYGIGNALTWWTALAVYAVHGTTGTWVLDADFNRDRADALGWNLYDHPPSGSVLTVEPAMLSARQWSSALLGDTTTKFISGVPEAFSIEPGGHFSLYAVRQTMPNGTCTGGGSGAFTCTSLIWEEQNLSASGSTTLDVELGPTATVVHALAGTRRGLSLEQTGSGGISLKQSSGGHRIAAAGDAIRASASGTGAVSIQVNGNVIGGLTGRVPDADGISAATAEGPVRVAAGSVTGLRHGIAAVAGGPGSVAVEARGAVSGQFGSGVYAKASDGGVTISAATAAGGEAGIHARAAGRVSISVNGQVTGGDAAIKVEAGEGAPVRISLESGAVVGSAGKAGIVGSGGDAWIEVKTGAQLNGDVRLGDRPDTLNVRGGTVSGKIHLGRGNDVLALHGGTFDDIDLGYGSDALNFERGLSTVTGDINGVPSLHFKSGSVTRIANSKLIDSNSSIDIGSGAIVILDDLGWRKFLGGKYGGITIEGTLNTADGVMGREHNYTWLSWAWYVLRTYSIHGTTGTWVLDADFDRGRADALAWNLYGNDTEFEAMLTVEPAMLSSKHGSTVMLGNTYTKFRSSVPEAFSIDQEGLPYTIRQILPSGTCASGGSGAFTCTSLIWEQQNLSASGTDRLDVVLGSTTTVVHALTGTRNGLLLAQTGSGGISLRQTSGRHRIAAAGHAIQASASGTGSVDISVDGAVIGGLTGRVPEADGIAADAAGGAVSVTASSVTGLRHGIAASGGGSGGVDVAASGTVIGWFGKGISAAASGGDATVSAATVTGGEVGIMVSGTGAVSIQASGRVQADDPERGAGIHGVASGAGALSITAADVKGAAFGVYAVSHGSGPVSVKAGGVEATGERGVAVRGVSSGTGPLSIKVANVTGRVFGVDALSRGSGAVSVQAGYVRATSFGGMAVQGVSSGTGALSIKVAGVRGWDFGIRAVGKGSGAVSVVADGNVTSLNGTGRHGVHARASGAGSLTVSVGGNLLGGETAVKAVGGGGGDVFVTTSRSVIGFNSGLAARGAGIYAIAQGGDIVISASGASRFDKVYGADAGIMAVSSGTGSVSISTSLNVWGDNGPGIHVVRSEAGSVAISVSKGVLGTHVPAVAKTPIAIRTQSPSGSSISISLDSGTHVAMSGKDAVVGSDGNTSMTVNSGARLDGRVRLGSGDDALVFDGGPFSGVEEMDGGAGADTLTFRRGSGALHASVVSEGLKGWETIVVESGASISGDVRLAGDSGSLRFIGAGVPLGDLDGGSGSANTLEFQNVGTATLPSSSDLTGWETIRIGAGSSIAFGGQNRVVAVGTLAVSSGGTLDVGKDGDTSDRLTVSGDFAGGGAITLNANFMPDEGASDRLTITGNVTGWTSVHIPKVGENRSVSDSDRPTRIDGVIKVQGSVAANAFGYSEGGFIEVLYRLEFDAQNSEFDLVRFCFPTGPSSCVDPSGAGGASALSQPSVAVGASALAAPMAMSAPVAMALAAPQSESAAVGLAGAFVPACLETRPGSGAFSCGGVGVSSPQRLGATGTTALSVKLAPQTEVDTDGTAFSLTQSGAGGIAFERKEGGAAIRAKGDAIAARNAGGGFVSISAGGAIAAGGDGVSAISDARGEGVRIDVATVAAGGDGVSVEAAAGGVSIAADDAKGRGAGIRVRTGNGGTGVEISAGSAEGGVDGISVDHGGGGEVRISATGAVSGARGDGVHARSEAGHVSVRVSGAVSGGAADGTAAIRTDGASAAVTLDRGASVRATGSGAAVMDGAGSALVTVREGASILGGVSLGAGADELVLAGGDFGGITGLDGGPGRDALRIEAGRGSLPALSNGAVSGVESVIVSGDAVIEGDLLLGEGAGELVFADGARIDGHGRLDGGGGASLSLRGVSGEMNAARLSGWTSLEIGEGSRVTLAGAGLGRDAAESLSVAGTMAFGSDARAGDAFTVEGDFEGGGRVEIDADLAAGSADRLAIEGDVSGTTEIALRDLTPSGAEPSGAEMAVVSVGGEADASAFRLAGGAVARGAFLYDLRMAPEGGVFSLVADGGVSDTGAALRSSDAAIARGLARAATLQARAAARAVASVWARIGSAATFAERGAALAGRDAVDLSARKTRPVWMRLHGDRWDYGAGGAAMIDSSGFEVGMDLLSRESSAGKWIAGLTAQYGTVGAEAAAGGGVGRQGASGYGVGATLSWLGYGGFYADAQAQAGMSDSDFSSDTGGAIRSGVSARTAVAALELGWRVAASDSATIVPQAQISMSGVSGDGFVSGSLDVAESSAASLDGRIGLAAEIALREGYLRFSGSLLRALSELDGTVINGRTVEHGLPGGWAEFAVGGSLDLSEDRVLFLDGTWRTGLGGDAGDAGGASISGGLKLNW